MDYGMLNLFSLVLGLIAWGLPFVWVYLAGRLKKYPLNTSAISFLCCATAILFQLMYQAHLVAIWDASALMDTTDFSAYVSTVLLVGTVAINVFCEALKRK